ncbi:glycosyltransferase family 2 protein [Bosea sp. NBC_00550]|uniref:glycosyltransferase family 2 protein n=1 Tax=Bosea sp. NBC_00550 TaxID=2969621 RepID=UPI00223072EE|nr:glycosyltransferase [Bosea sp. NBC_00550]UZF91756.1 glycosyltransferase [Bosea sp. NBC_00550]
MEVETREVETRSVGMREDRRTPAPRIAVIITCWNYERFVGRAIRSVQGQSCAECDLVVVDDGSTDGSWDAIRETGATAFRIANGGQRAACLFGLDQTSAPFVLFLDADDELKPGALAAILPHLDAGVAKVQFQLARIDENGERVGAAFPPLSAGRDRDHLVQRVLRTGVYTTPPTSGNVFRRDVCELLREADYDRAADGVILFAAPFLGDVVSLPEELALYRVHAANDSGLGKPLDPGLLRRDLVRFARRMEHLRQVVARSDVTVPLVQAQEAYFHRERSFYLALATGNRLDRGQFPALIGSLWREYYPAKIKAVMTLFFALAAVLPPSLAVRLLGYRLQPGRRSPLGFLKALMN